VEACQKINDAGLLIYAGFILGFDGERKGAGDRIQTFVAQTNIPQPMLGILQAWPHTALWERLKKEDRLHIDECTPIGDQNALTNFEPTRPINEIAEEYVAGFWQMYDPAQYLYRCLHQCLNISVQQQKKAMRFPLGKGLRLIAQVLWLQGVRRGEIRLQFWRQLAEILWKQPKMFNVYIGLCAAGEHFWDYREVVKDKISEQMGYDLLHPPTVVEKQSIREEVSVGL
ncbi:MAG: DUF4070 domain-containing protein, partial [Phormidesmis sp.]